MDIEEYLILYETFCIFGGDALFRATIQRRRGALLKHNVSIVELLAMEHVVAYQALLWIQENGD